MHHVDLFHLSLIHSGFDRGLNDALLFLDDDEKERYYRFKNNHARDTFLQTRKIIKTVLAEKLSCKPGDIRFTYSETGKPYLDALKPTLSFSLSHSKQHIAVAIAECDVGIDVEDAQRCSDILDKVEFFLNHDAKLQIDQCQTVEQAADRFACYWSCMESYVKLKGSAIWQEKDRVVLTSREVTATQERFTFEDIYFVSLTSIEDCRISVAMRQSYANIRFHAWSQ